MPHSKPDIIYSDLCCTVTVNDITVDLRIFRLAHDRKWALEVVHNAGIATIWDKLFDTDRDALEAFEQTVIDEGIEIFLDDGDIETVH